LPAGFAQQWAGNGTAMGRQRVGIPLRAPRPLFARRNGAEKPRIEATARHKKMATPKGGRFRVH